MLHKHKQILEVWGPIAAAGVTGALVGTLATRGIHGMRRKYMDCRSIKDPMRRDQCTVKIINSMITTLKDARDECDQTPDPANCKYALVKKIDKLYSKKLRLQKHINMFYRSRMEERDIS